MKTENKLLNGNWRPAYDAFRAESLAGRVALSATDRQYAWLYENVRKRPFTESSDLYLKRLLEIMTYKRDVFAAVFESGVDFCLYENRLE
jgi:hypothetical protein